MSIFINTVQSWLHKAIAEIQGNLTKLGVNCSVGGALYRLYLSGLSRKLLFEEELLQHLVKNDSTPVVIDIAPCAIINDELVIAIMPSGHQWVSDPEHTWGGRERGPFKVCPWSLPGSLMKTTRPTKLEFIESGRLLMKSLDLQFGSDE